MKHGIFRNAPHKPTTIDTNMLNIYQDAPSYVYGNVIPNQAPDLGYDQVFFEDVLELFLGTNSGHLSKYIYDFNRPQEKDRPPHQTDTWNEIVLHSKQHYIPRADKKLLGMALQNIKNYVPEEITYVDFGVGSDETINGLTLPLIRLLNCKRYIAVDYCEKFLATILEVKNKNCDIKTIHTDFFMRPSFPIEKGPALGVMTGCTIGNMYGSMRDLNVDLNLTHTLIGLKKFLPQGWFIISMDANHNERTLFNNYMSSLHCDLFLSIMFRIKSLLPTNDFNPNLFKYMPEWHPKLQLFAHMAQATEAQEFQLGTSLLRINKGQKFHLLNSYKFDTKFFEACCTKARLSVVKRWDHDTPVKLYLLKSENKG